MVFNITSRDTLNRWMDRDKWTLDEVYYQKHTNKTLFYTGCIQEAWF